MRMQHVQPLVTMMMILTLGMDEVMGVKWLALSRNTEKVWPSSKECRKSNGLSADQIKLCQQNVDLMGTVSIASAQGVDSCQKQFFDRRWNCSTIAQVPTLTKELKRGTREQAFTYAIASASLTHSIARACSVGITTKCSCGKLPHEAPTGDFKWGGCGDDTEFGLRFSELFTAYHNDKISKNKKTMMNSHNTAAGNKIVYDSLTTACKCHGVSGSCSIKTCWKALADFGQIAETLKNKYGTAIEVKSTRKDGAHKFVSVNKFIKINTIPNDELVYIKKVSRLLFLGPEVGLHWN